MHHLTLSMTASGWVKSTTTWARRASLRLSPMSRPATRSRSGVVVTARHTSPPIRPFTPNTATRMRPPECVFLNRVEDLSQPGTRSQWPRVTRTRYDNEPPGSPDGSSLRVSLGHEQLFGAAWLHSLSCSGLIDHGDERELATVVVLGDLDLELLAAR